MSFLTIQWDDEPKEISCGTFLELIESGKTVRFPGIPVPGYTTGTHFRCNLCGRWRITTKIPTSDFHGCDKFRYPCVGVMEYVNSTWVVRPGKCYS